MSSVCIVVPCYNEAARLASEVFVTYLEEAPNVHFCFVDDGSADQTRNVLEQLQARQPERIEALILPENQGKAGAVRAGMLHCAGKSFDYLGYFDADLATPLSAINDLTEVLDKNPQIDIVMGSRIKHLGADIQRTLFRHYVGRVVATFISNILNLPVYDTQCGAKLFRSNVVNALFTNTFISPWLFDVELLARYGQLHGRAVVLERVAEQPLRQWIEQSDSRISSTYMFRMWYELYRINQTYKNISP
ncbi:glycosyltransferase family 2 protein [Spirosoma sp. BT702]|uniref:dolichyl-phosphate beta-glucosyltransferase n=1 Tax=Spirosoma profusum TaxID=2771354 RepID=A0A926XTL8_9BACT|nr:dolichyl-phosphate beta-glucosyltransferase [Spirosoma profusum]MBD2699310.1 glycosyltransferase family 2 protein [Spirosoma profusum]